MHTCLHRAIFILLLLFSSPIPTQNVLCRIMSRTIIHLMDRTDPYHIVSTSIDIDHMSELYTSATFCYKTDMIFWSGYFNVFAK